MNLKDKLNIYTKKETSGETKTNNFSLEEINGAKHITEFGPIWRIENRICLEDNYFNISFPDIICDIAPLLKFNKFPEDLQVEDLLFFDLETTALNIGTGNYPFLVGLGYIDGEDFVTEQLFMESYSDEIAILHYILPFFEKAKAVVAFNGKTYDVPLIKTRYMINKVYGFPVNIPVVDLIIPARRIFKSIFENCALQTLEKNVIGFERVDDVPGWMIPEIYFTFQQEGEWSRIPGVIEHNRLDIISMYALMFIESNIFNLIKEKKYHSVHKQSLFNIAKHLYNTHLESFLDLMDYLDNDIIEDESVFQKFSITLKRQSEWNRAINYWKKSKSLFSLQELAKYYEHKEKNYIKALEYCNVAIDLLDKNIFDKKNIPSKIKKKRFSEDFEKRITRLTKKKETQN